MPAYRFAHTCLASALLLPMLPTAAAATPRYRIDIATRPLLPATPSDARHDWLDPQGQLTLRAARWGHTHYLVAPGLAEARCETNGRMTLWSEPGTGKVALQHIVMDQFLPRLLAADGIFMLHAAAMANPGRPALVLTGETGFGKSTLSAAFARDGARLINDDCLRLDTEGDAVHASGSYPGLRLLPDSLSALYADATPATTPVAEAMAKRRIAVPATSLAPIPVGAFVVLQPPGDGSDICIEPLPPAAASIELLRGSFTLDPTDMTRARALLAQAAHMVARVPVYAVTYPRDYTQLPAVMAALRALLPPIDE